MDKLESARAWPGDWLMNILENGANLLFDRRPGYFSMAVRSGWLLGLYLAGVYLWGVFFSWGNIAFDFLDWVEVTGPRYAIMRDAALKNEFPLHGANPAGLRGVTDRYLSIADAPLSPQFYLLRFMEAEQFVFLDTLLLYTLGYFGLLLIYRRYRLSVGVFTILFLLFNFNGNLTAHLAVGHAPWVGQFLLSYFVYLVLVLVEEGGKWGAERNAHSGARPVIRNLFRLPGRAAWAWVAGMAITLASILLQGHFHLYVWCLLFLGLLGVFYPRVFKIALLGGLAGVLVCLPRLLPPVLVLQEITQEYLGGFASLTDLMAGLVVLRDPERAIMRASTVFPLNGWELDHYIGLLGAALVIWFGIYAPLKAWKQNGSWMGGILWPCLALTILSLGNVMEVVVGVITVPPLTGERVTARILILPLVFWMTLGALCLQGALDQEAAKRPRKRLHLWEVGVLVGMGCVLFHDLNRHLAAWRIRYLDGMTHLFPKLPFDPAQHGIANHADPQYTGLLLGGLVITLLTVSFLVWQMLRKSPADLAS